MTGAGRSGTTWQTLERRAGLLRDIRAYFAAAGVLEVDTPLLRTTCASDPHIPETPVLGQGQSAYLQSSPEGLLKALLAEFGRPVYQLGHVYRAAEVGRRHQPEFTMLEWYRPGWSMQALMDEVGTILRLAAPAHSAPIRSTDWSHCFEAATGIAASSGSDALYRRASALGHSTALLDQLDEGGLRDLLFSHCVQPTLGRSGPEFVTGFLAGDAAFARLDPKRPGHALRFELYWQGVELANGGEELTDAQTWLDRAARDNMQRAACGASRIPRDDDWLWALRRGLPACSGVALGVDRLLMLAIGATSIQSVVPFAWRQT